MDSITKLQQEVASVRNDLSRIDIRLSGMDKKLKELNESIRHEKNYERIYNLAKGMPVWKHPIVTLNQKDKRVYIGMLLMVATLEEPVNEEQLLFLQRIIMNDTDANRIDFYMGNLGQIQPENAMFQLSEYIRKWLSEPLLLDMIIIANLGNGCTKKSYSVIADMASLMELKQEDLETISSIAATVLLQKWNRKNPGFKKIIEIDSTFGYYLREVENWDMVIQNAKKEERELKDKEKKDVAKRKETGQCKKQDVSDILIAVTHSRKEKPE